METIIALIVAFSAIPAPVIATTSPILPVYQAPEPVKELTIDEKITKYAKKHNADEVLMRRIIKCESSFNPKAVNWSDSHKYSKGSHGIAQFSQETIKGYGKAIGLPDADPYNPDEALEVMSYMFSINQQRHWSCYKNLLKET